MSTIHSSNIYSPVETSNQAIAQYRKAKEQKDSGIELNIKGTNPTFGEYFAPLLNWEICAVQAQTSNGKTMFANYWVRQIAEQLRRQKRDEVIIYVSLEESIEAMAFSEFGRVLDVKPAEFARGVYEDESKILLAKSEIDNIPVWRIAESANSPENSPALTLSNIYRSIQELASGNITGEKWKPAVVVVDYLQVLPIDPEIKKTPLQEQRRLQVANDVNRLRKMTVALQCPIIVPLQAKQELSGSNPPYHIPGTYDGRETSEIATRFDRIISLWLPKTTFPVGTYASNKDKSTGFTVTEEQCFIKVNKQRGGLPAGKVWELRVDYNKKEYYDSFYKGA